MEGRLTKGVERSTPAFVGREQELDILSKHLSCALRGEPMVALLSGEAGVGKTRLLREFGGMGRRLGLSVVSGCAMEDSATPYLAFLGLLDKAATVAGESGSLIAVFGSGRQQGVGGQRTDDVGHDWLRMFTASIQSIVGLARREPLLVLLDDMHWSDGPSLELLGQLVYMLAETYADDRLPLMLVVAHRPVPAQHRLAKLTQRLRREAIVTDIGLDGLGAAETAALLRSLGRARVANPLLDEVQRVTHGYPLFVQEMLHHLERHDLLEERSGLTTLKRAPSEVRLPEDVRTALGQRLESLSAEEVALFSLAALMSDNIAVTRLQSVSQLSAVSLSQAVERALSADLIVVDGERYRFRHPLLRQLLADRLVGNDKRTLHRRIGHALNAEPESAALSLEIATHLSLGEDPDHALIALHAQRAADHAFSLFAYGQAARMYAITADCLPEPHDVSGWQRLGELRFLAGRAHQHDFDFAACTAQYDQAMQAYARAEDLVGQAITLRWRTRVQYLTAATSYGQRLDLAPQERVLAQLAESEPLVRGLLLEVMSQVHWTARHTARAEELARAALALASQVNDDRLRHHAHFSLGLALFQGGQLSAAMESYRESWSCALRVTDPWCSVPPMQRISVLHVSFGELDAAERLSREGRARSLEVHYAAETSFAVANLACVALARGQLGMVEEHAREALQWTQRARYPWGAMIALLGLAWARCLQGRYSDAHYAVELLGTPGEVFDQPGPPIQFSVAIWRDFLNIECAAATLTEEHKRVPLLAQLLAASPFDANGASAACVVALCAAGLGLADAARDAYARLERMHQAGMVLSTGAVFSIARVLGVTAALLELDTQAESYFDQAVRATQQAGALPELGLSLLDRASFWLSRVPEKREQAQQLAARAHDISVALALPPMAARAARLLSLQRSPPLALTAPSEKPELDAGERLLLKRIAQGRSHEQIGAELLVHAASAAQRADDLFAKMGVNGATLATAYAFAHGLLGPNNLEAAQPTVIMVTDMVDFTGLVQREGDLVARTVIHVHNRTLRQHIIASHGKEITHTGDGLMVAFSSATDAAQCAREIQRAFAKYNRTHVAAPIHVRIGLNAGHLLPEEDRMFGAALIAAVRVCASAGGDQIRVSQAVLDLADQAISDRSRPLGEVSLKGFAEPIALYDLAWDR